MVNIHSSHIVILDISFRYLEAVTPTLQSLHPSSIVDAMHFKVVSSVKAQNKLKQEEDSGEFMEKKDEKETDMRKQHDKGDLSEQNVDEMKSKTSRLQVMFSLSRVSQRLHYIITYLPVLYSLLFAISCYFVYCLMHFKHFIMIKGINVPV